jgi:hypothetical protein
MASISPNYIKVNGLNDSISTDAIVAYFETARCGSGRVVEVVYQGRYNSVACVGLQEINADSKLKGYSFNYVHSLSVIRSAVIHNTSIK